MKMKTRGMLKLWANFYACLYLNEGIVVDVGGGGEGRGGGKKKEEEE